MLRASAVLLVLAAAACTSETAYVDPQGNMFSGGGLGGGAFAGSSALQFTGEGAIEGDIGPVKNFGANRDVVISGYDDGVCTYVTLEGVGENGTGSMVIDVMPRVDEMDDGEHGIAVDEETYEGTIVSSHADSNDGQLYDANADDGRVILTPLANGGRQVTVEARYGDSNTTSTATFRLRPINNN